MDTADNPKHEIHKTGMVRLRAIEPEDLPLLKEWRNKFKHFFREYRFITVQLATGGIFSMPSMYGMVGGGLWGNVLGVILTG